MDEKDAMPMQPLQQPEASPIPPVPYRLTDVDVFMHLLPNIVGSYATKHDSAETIRDLSIKLARETMLALRSSGFCLHTVTCFDAPMWASSSAVPATSVVAQPQPAHTPTTPPHPQLGNNNGHGLQGAMMAHYPNTEVQKIHGL